MRPKVYSWGLSGALKSDLERAARLRNVSVSSILDLAVPEWLKKNSLVAAANTTQRELHKAATKCIGVLTCRNSRHAETARETIRERLRRRRDR